VRCAPRAVHLLGAGGGHWGKGGNMKGKWMKAAIVLVLAAMLAIPLVAGCGG